MKKVLITTSSYGKDDPSVIALLNQEGYEVVLNPFGRKLTEEEVLELLWQVGPVAMIAGVEPLTARVLGRTSGLKVISRCGIGLDNIDLDVARQNGIAVLNTPDAPTQAVAELTLGLMIASLRKIVEVDAGIRAGNWRRPMGKLLGGQTVGIVGCGRIGSMVAQLLKNFGSKLIGYDPFIKEHSLIPLVSLDKLLSQADIVSLHIPYNQSVSHLLNKQLIDNMKTGAVLINTSRGGIVDEEALYDAVIEGRLAGACLDTFEREPYTGPLSKLSQVILTPHIGSYAKEARVKMEREAALNLLSAMKKLI